MTKTISQSKKALRRLVPTAVSLGALLMVALAPSISEARGPHGEGPSEERMLGHLQYRLKLTPEQMEKVRPVVQEEIAQRQALKAEHHKKMAEARNEFRKAMESRRGRLGERLDGILTPEQKEEFTKMNEERRARMEARGKEWAGRGHGKGAGRGPGPGPGCQ
ncbi:MAG: hypothetical protein JXB25_07755 [Deltaproteobacteria bacterium]|nr:hypothetical protein [Deltaproteobacteria bacterium]